MAQRRLEEQVILADIGQGEARDLVDAQQDLVEAQNSAAAALTEYILSGLALYRDMELIRVTEEGITIDSTPLEEDTP